MCEFSGTPMDQLKQLMARLRHPTQGCPWDKEQTFETVAPYTIEEAYEVEDAIARKDSNAICEELGDLLLQIVFHSRMAEEQGLFDFDEVTTRITEKMIERHPHVFGKKSEKAKSFNSQAWEDQKTNERNKKNNGPSGILDGVAPNLPALMYSEKLIKRVKSTGIDPTDFKSIQQKISDTLINKKVSKSANDKKKNEEWIGEIFFLLTHLSVHIGVDSEKSLRETSRKFKKYIDRLEKKSLIKKEESIQKANGENKSDHPLIYENFMPSD